MQNVDEPGDPAEAGEQLHSQHFFIGLDELLAGGSSEHLTRLSADGTAGRWQARARDLLAWSKRCAERPREPEGMSQLLRTCQTGSETLARENAALKSDLTQLKRILIEMETRKK